MIGKLLGHHKMQTTARYAQLARDLVKASAARIAGSLRGTWPRKAIHRAPVDRYWQPSRV